MNQVIILAALVLGTIVSVSGRELSVKFSDYKGVLPKTATSGEGYVIGENKEIFIDLRGVALVTTGNNGYLQCYPGRFNPCYMAFELEERCNSITLSMSSLTASMSFVSLYVDDEIIGDKVRVDTNENDYKFVIPSNMKDAGTSYKFVVENGDAKVTKAIFDLGDKENLKSADLKFDCMTVYSHINDAAFQKPSLSFATTAEIEYFSSDETVANVDKLTGEVMTKSIGECEIIAKSEENSEYLAGETSYKLYVSECASSLSALDSPNTIFFFDFDMIVGYQHAGYTYLKEKTGENWILLFDNAVPEYNSGDVVEKGWYGLYTERENWPRLTAITTPGMANGNEKFEVSTVSYVTNSDLNKIVELRDVNITEEEGTGDLIGYVSGDKYLLRDVFGIGMKREGKYNLLCAVGKQDEELVLYPIEFRGGTGIEILKNEGDWTYYRLDGKKASSKSKGIIIRKGRGNAVKEIR